VNLGTANVIRADARRLPLPDNSVDLVVTSPPYFALRSYQDGGEHYAGQIGSETTPAEFVDALLEVTRECVRVLKPIGSLFVNLGDKYSGAQAQNSNGTSNRNVADSAMFWRRTDPKRTGIPNKSLMGIPWRYAIACIDQLGLILRAEIIWSKPNGLPESVTDRVRRSHETWFHFTLQPRYYSAIDEIREPHDDKNRPNGPSRRDGVSAQGYIPREKDGIARKEFVRTNNDYNPLGKLPGSVWTIPTEPLTVPPELGVDHFAAFPTEWPRRIIQGWSPAGICVECGEGRRPVSERETVFDKARDQVHATEIAARGAAHVVMSGGTAKSTLNGRTTRTISNYACACLTPDAPIRPSLILDPFGGTGTVALVARTLGRHGISVDLSHDYSRLAQWRTADPGQLAKAARVDKPPAQTMGQADLFSLLDGGAA